MRHDSAHIPFRTCLACGGKKDKFTLIRFVISKDHALMPDPGQKLAGRGYYLCPATDCYRKLIKSRRFRKITAISSDPQKQNFYREYKKMIQPDRIRSLVGLARKAGKVTFGQQAVQAAVKRKQAQLVIIAEDAAENTKDQFRELANRTGGVNILITGRKADWGRLFGKENTAVLAVSDRNFVRGILTETPRKMK